MSDPENQEAKEDRDARQVAGVALVTMITRGAGALFMLAAPIVGYNLGGAAHALGLDDSAAEYIGVALLIIGVVDFVFMPMFFRGLLEKRGISVEDKDNSPWAK